MTTTVAGIVVGFGLLAVSALMLAVVVNDLTVGGWVR